SPNTSPNTSTSPAGMTFMANFELFEKRRTPPSREPYVTFLKSGVISMNAFAYDLVHRPSYFEFLYDADARIVALRPLDHETEFSYPVRELKSGSGGTYSVSAKAFMLYYGLDMSASIRRLAYVEDGLLCVDLNSAGTDV